MMGLSFFVCAQVATQTPNNNCLTASTKKFQPYSKRFNNF